MNNEILEKNREAWNEVSIYHQKARGDFLQEGFMFLVVFIILIITSCDTFSGISIRYNNLRVPISQIYLTLKNNLNHHNVELIYVPPKEYFGIFPKWGKAYYESYEYISINFGNIWIDIYCKEGLSMRYIKLGGIDKKMIKIVEIRMNEIKNCLIEIYPQYFNENDFIKEIFYHGKLIENYM